MLEAEKEAKQAEKRADKLCRTWTFNGGRERFRGATTLKAIVNVYQGGTRG